MSFVERVNQGESLVSWLNWLTEPPAVYWSLIMGDLLPGPKGVYCTHTKAYRTGPPSCPVQGIMMFSGIGLYIYWNWHHIGSEVSVIITSDISLLLVHYQATAWTNADKLSSVMLETYYSKILIKIEHWKNAFQYVVFIISAIATASML